MHWYGLCCQLLRLHLDSCVFFPLLAAPLACNDGSTEGLAHFEDVAVCAGSWKGHVRKGKVLCAAGWHVCNARDAPLLARVGWKDANSVNGCYALNVANNFGTCAR